MITCVFEEILEYNTYVLRCQNNKTIHLMIEFIGGIRPSVGDKMLIHKDLLNATSPVFTQPYAFEYLKGYDPVLVQKAEDREFIVLRIKNQNCALKRIYG